MDVGEDTAASDGDITKKLVEFLVVANGELKVTGSDGLLLVISGSVTGQFEDFSSEVFEDGSQVDRSTRPDALSVVALAEEAVNTTNGELESCLFRARG